MNIKGSPPVNKNFGRAGGCMCVHKSRHFYDITINRGRVFGVTLLQWGYD